MYDTFERDRSLFAPGQFCEVRYEQLVAEPIEQMRRVYEELQLGDFETARPAIEKYFAGKKDYKTNRYEMTPELRDKITQRWSTFLKQYGYAAETPAVPTPSGKKTTVSS
jgi:omega-hydroxy-beta-dihydromenaquinone-9 sulfotransferase